MIARLRICDPFMQLAWKRGEIRQPKAAVSVSVSYNPVDLAISAASAQHSAGQVFALAQRGEGLQCCPHNASARVQS